MVGEEWSKKPDLGDLRKAGMNSDFGIVYEEDDSFVVPKVDQIQVAPIKPKQEPKIIEPKPAKQKKPRVNHLKNIKEGVRQKKQQAKESFTNSLNHHSRQIRDFGFKRISSVRKYQTAIISIALVYSLGFTLIRGADAKNNITSLSMEAQNNITETFDYIDKGDLANALKSAESTRATLTKLQFLIQSWGQDVKYLSLVPENHSRLVAYEGLLNSASTILDTFSSLNRSLSDSLKQEAAKENADINGLPQVDLNTFQDVILKTVDEVQKNLTQSEETLKRSEAALPANLQQQTNRAISALDKTLASISSIRTLVSHGLPWISGSGGETRNILVLFQNNTELRASGGFLGSFALVKFKDGKIQDINFETNIYKLDTTYSQKMKINPPDELAYSTIGWSMRDANFAIDFPESMAKVKEFFTAETGEKVDGVVALDTTLFLDLLRVVGPIDMPAYKKTISSDNFLSDVQYEVEKGYFERAGGSQENEPKKILADMMPIFLNKMVSASRDNEKMPLILGALGKGLSEKHLLFNVSDPELQSIFRQMGYAGQVNYELSDYLYVHNTNIQGKKSSLNVTETLKHHVEIEAGGHINSSLEVIRKHNGTGAWPDGVNINLVRVLLPQNSAVATFTPKAGNFWPNFDAKNKIPGDYYTGEEAGKAKVSFWQSTKPGEMSDSVLNYRPNYSIDTQGDNFTYHLSIQKQPGSLGDNYELEVTYPKGFKPTNVKNYDQINHKILIKDTIKTDKDFALSFERIKN